ncbi:MAG: hypothetical protein J7K23_01740 [Thermoproteales archaeon]|nr:hypothetical protein [Thermoproteales archaeon]
MNTGIGTYKKLKDLLDELLVTLSKSSDPFKIDINRYVKELEKIFPYIDIQGLDIDSEIIYTLTDIVKKQKEWLKNKSFLFLLGSLIALIKIAKMNSEDLANELTKAWKPIVSLEQITFNEILRGMNYMSQKKFIVFEEGILKEVKDFNQDDLLKDFIKKTFLEEYIRKVERHLSVLFKEKNIVEYGVLIGSGDFKEKYMRGLALSYLAREGRIILYYDAIEEKVYILKPEYSNNKEYESIVIRVS